MSALSVIDKINSMKSNKGGLDESRQLFSDCMAIFVAEGWSNAELSEFRDSSGAVMRTGSAEEKQALFDYMTSRIDRSLLRVNPEAGINERIRADLKSNKKLKLVEADMVEVEI